MYPADVRFSQNNPQFNFLSQHGKAGLTSNQLLYCRAMTTGAFDPARPFAFSASCSVGAGATDASHLAKLSGRGALGLQPGYSLTVAIGKNGESLLYCSDAKGNLAPPKFEYVRNGRCTPLQSPESFFTRNTYVADPTVPSGWRQGQLTATHPQSPPLPPLNEPVQPTAFRRAGHWCRGVIPGAVGAGANLVGCYAGGELAMRGARYVTGSNEYDPVARPVGAAAGGTALTGPLVGWRIAARGNVLWTGYAEALSKVQYEQHCSPMAIERHEILQGAISTVQESKTIPWWEKAFLLWGLSSAEAGPLF